MVIPEAHFADGEEHAGGLDATDFADFEGDAGAWDEAAGGSKDRFHAGTSVRGAADDGNDADSRIDFTGAQAIGVGMGKGFDDVSDAE